MAKEVEDLYTKHNRFRTKPNMNEIVSVVLAEICRHSIVFVVVDALDECPEDRRVRAKFVEKLQHILSSTTPTKTKVRLLITSRLTNHAFLDAIEFKIQAPDDDIKRIVCQRIEEGLSDDNGMSQKIRQNDKLKDELAQMIVERAGNVYLHPSSNSVAGDCTNPYRRFLIAKLQLDSLATKTTLRNLREAMKCDPRDLDELYMEAWNRINDQNRDSRDDAKEALCWLSCSFRQLRREELRHALATKMKDKAMDEEKLMNFDRLVRSCMGLVTVDMSSQIVRFIHRTAQDFFETRASEFFPDAHTRLARTCLTYLLFDEFSQGPCDTLDLLEGGIEDSLDDHIDKHISATQIISTRLERNPFMEYAAHYWGNHAHGEATEQALEREILGFLNRPRALASTVQVQYLYEWLWYERWLSSSKHTPIHVVVSFALEHVLKALLQTVTDEDLNIEDETKKTAFHWAIECGQSGCARLLFEARADIRTRDVDGLTALYKASSFRNQDIVEMILEHDKTAEVGAEEIACAIHHGQKPFLERYIRSAPKPAGRANSLLMQSLAEPGLIRFAVSLGADVNLEDEHGRTALLEAVETGNGTAAKALVAAGASTNVLEKRTGKTLLQVAASSQMRFKEHIESVRRLWHGLADRRRLGKHSVRKQKDLWVKKLLDHTEHNPEYEPEYDPVEADVRDPKLLAALDEDYGYPDVIRLLLNNGADSGTKTSCGETVLHLAVGSTARVKVLLDMRAHLLDVDAQDNQGRSALHHAAAVGNSAAMEVLLANGASLELRDSGGASALHYAVCHSTCVELAIRKGCNTKAVDSQKRTPLHYLAMMGNSPLNQNSEVNTCSVMVQLLQAGVDAGAVDSQGQEVEDYLQHLMNHGVDPHGFEERVGWMGMQLDRGLRMFKQARIILDVTWKCAEQDTLKDFGVFWLFFCLVTQAHRHMECSNGQSGTLSRPQWPQLQLFKKFPHLQQKLDLE